MKALCDLRTMAAVSLAAAAIGLAAPASAQTYPSRTITVIVPFAPGGTGDIVARVVSEKLGAALGQSIVVENRAGAAAPSAPAPSWRPPRRPHPAGWPDRRNRHHAALEQGRGLRPHKDLQPVALATVVPLALVAPGNASILDRRRDARSLGRAGPLVRIGRRRHARALRGEVLKLKTNANLAHVPYKGAGPALNDLLGGHVDFFFSGFPGGGPLREGRAI